MQQNPTTDQSGPAAALPSILERLLVSAKVRFDRSPVIVRRVENEGWWHYTRYTAAFSSNVAEDLVRDLFGNGQDTTELERDIRERELSASPVLVTIWQQRTFPVAVNDPQGLARGRMLALVIIWITAELERDPEMNRESLERYSHREDKAWLKANVPSDRRSTRSRG